MTTARAQLPSPSARGRLITLEGGEGTGKSTQLAYVVRWLQQSGIEAIGTREPGGSPGRFVSFPYNMNRPHTEVCRAMPP